MENKSCKDCGILKPITEFRLHSTGSKYRRSYCNPCHNKRCTVTLGKSSERSQFRRSRALDITSTERQSNIKRDKYIVQDTKKNDKKKGRENDIDREFVRSRIAEGCSYCGDTENRMTLDRIDNSKGHTKENVMPACIRCNLIRGSMPYEAWEKLFPIIAQIRTQGLFGQWTGDLRRKLAPE